MRVEIMQITFPWKSVCVHVSVQEHTLGLHICSHMCWSMCKAGGGGSKTVVASPHGIYCLLFGAGGDDGRVGLNLLNKVCVCVNNGESLLP